MGQARMSAGIYSLSSFGDRALFSVFLSPLPGIEETALHSQGYTELPAKSQDLGPHTMVKRDTCLRLQDTW